MAGHRTGRPTGVLTVQHVRNATRLGTRFDGHGLFLRVAPNGARFRVQRIVIRGKRCGLGRGSVYRVTAAEDLAPASDNRRPARAGCAGPPRG